MQEREMLEREISEKDILEKQIAEKEIAKRNVPERNVIEDIVKKLIYQMQNLKDDGTGQKCKYNIVSMEEWEWPQGVALFAMFQYYELTQDEKMLEYLKGWYDRNLERGLPEVNVNTTCPMLGMTYLYEITGNETYLPYLKDWCRTVMEKLPRTEESGIQHVTSDFPFDGQLWDDTLYMTVLFLARMGVLLKEDSLIQESIRQFLVHIKYLSDTKTGLFFHGWNFHGCHNFADALWGRGNSWYTAGLVDYLSIVSVGEGVEWFLLSTLERQVRALSSMQDQSGLWHTILDHSDTYLETSASSGFAYGILKAVRKGLLPEVYESVGMKAVQGVLEKIDEEGTVLGVSRGTPVFPTVEEYNQVETCAMPYGQSMALLMLTEAMRHL